MVSKLIEVQSTANKSQLELLSNKKTIESLTQKNKDYMSTQTVLVQNKSTIEIGFQNKQKKAFSISLREQELKK